MRTVMLWCALVATLGLWVASVQPAAASGPKVDCTLAVGVAEPEPFFESGQPHGLMSELKLKATGRDLIGFVEVRNAWYNGAYLFNKSRIKAGIDVPIARGTALFAEWERSYRTNDAWGWAGVKFDLGRWFR